MIRFTVYGIAEPKGSAKAFPFLDKQGKPRASVTSDNKKVKNWQNLVAAVAQEHRPPTLFDGAVSLRLSFYLQRPKSVSEKKRPHHTVRPDIDKLCRAILDALKGVFYKDDTQVVRVVAEKHYGDSRVEIEVDGV